ncbi:hypothetical protein HispidOSU_030429 [Sigmodon hispidus]
MRGAVQRRSSPAAEQAAPPLRPLISCWADAPVLARCSASADDRRPLRSSSPRPPQRTCPPAPCPAKMAAVRRARSYCRCLVRFSDRELC